MGHGANAGILGAQKVLHIKDVGEAAIRKYFLDSTVLRGAGKPKITPEFDRLSNFRTSSNLEQFPRNFLVDRQAIL